MGVDVPAQCGLVLQVERFSVGADQVADGAGSLAGDDRALLHIGREHGDEISLKFAAVQVVEHHFVEAVGTRQQRVLEALGEHVIAEGGLVVVGRLVLDLYVGDQVAGGGLEHQAVLVGPVRAEALVDPGDDLRKAFGLGIGERAGAGVDGGHLGFAARQFDRAVEGEGMSQVRELYFGAEVDALSPAAVSYQGRQGTAEAVVALEFGVAERYDERQEAVDAHEPAECIAEGVLVFVGQCLETVDGRLHGRVDLGVGAFAQQQGGGPFHLADVEHVEPVEFISGVEQQVWVGRRGDGLAVVDGERFAYLVCFVHEINDVRAGFGRVDAVEP